jgi:hypothetical protein
MEKRTAANRRNAEKSTGPRTTPGKLAVAGNGVAHGIYAFCPVVAGFESPQEWDGFRTEMMASFAPVGMLETTLAERLTLGAWRLRRVARYETEQIRSEQEAAKEHVGREIHFKTTGYADEIENVAWRIKWFERLLGITQLLMEGNDAAQVDTRDAKDLLHYLESKEEETYAEAHEYDQPEEDFEKSEQPEDPERWTVGSLRERVEVLAENLGMGDDYLPSLRGEINQAGMEALNSVKLAKRRLKEYRREHLLSDESALAKVMRYESHLSRLFHRDLHELQRLQAMRQGQRVAVPMAIDVDVASGLETATQSGV